MTSSDASPGTGWTGNPTPSRFAQWIVRLRWPLSLVMFAVVALVGKAAGGEVAELTTRLSALQDTSNGLAAQPLLFDPRMDIWFDGDDEGVQTYRTIEDRFVAEDYVVVAFEDERTELGVFGRESLAAIARLTEALATIPGVRHVRSLTSSPWIRADALDGDDERALVISDLVELSPDAILDPEQLSDDELVERMVAILGARRAIERVGEQRVRRVIGDASVDDYIGEPLLLGTIVDDTATTTTIQVQVLRGRVTDAQLDEVFGDDGARAAAPALHSVKTQHAALRGIDHVLRVERGLSVPTEEFAALRAEVDAMETGAEKERLAFELADPSRNFVTAPDGRVVRKYFDYDEVGGEYVDRTDPAQPVPAPAGFVRTPLSPYEFHVAGMPPFERNFMDVGMADAKFMGLVMLLIVLVLAILFRNVIGVVAPMLVVLGSIVFMVGWALARGDLFNNLTAISPNMLTAVGIADAVHLVSAWLGLRRTAPSKRALLVEVIDRNAVPVLLTSVTTAIGFYSLTVSRIQPVTMLGYTAGLGAIGAYLLSMTIVPAFLSIMPLPKERTQARHGAESHPLSSRMANCVLAKRVPIITTTAILVVVTAIGMSRVRIDTDFRAMFPDDNPVMSDFHWIESRMGGVGDLEIVFNGLDTTTDLREFDDERERLAELRLLRLGAERAPDDFAPFTDEQRAELGRLETRERELEASRIAASAEFFAELQRFEARLLEEMADPASPMHVITDLTSPLDILRKMHQVQTGDVAANYRVPGVADVPASYREEALAFDEWTEEWRHVPGQSAANLIAQYFLQYENGARPGENLATQMSPDRRFFRMQGRVHQAPTFVQKAAFARVQEIAEVEFPRLSGHVMDDVGPADAPISDVTLSGKTVLFSRTPEKFSLGFIESMALAIALITLLIGLIFRSVAVALISVVPNVLPILLPLSVIGLSGNPIDGPTVLVASVALGVCVDDTIHFFAKFVKARRAGKGIRDSLEYVYSHVGHALTATTMILVAGFAGLTFSDFRPNYMMGSLAITMFFLAWIADMFVTPALLSYLVAPEERRALAGCDAATKSDLDAPAAALSR